MTTNAQDVDVESPKPQELSFAPFIKEDEPSVATHLSDSDSDYEPSTHSRARYVTPLRKLALVAIVATLLGVAAGFGARHREGESTSSQSMTSPVSGEASTMETVVGSEEGHRAGASLTTTYVYNPNPQTTETDPPEFSLTVPETNANYNSRVEDPTSGTTVGVITSGTSTTSQTAAPYKTTAPAFNGVVGMVTTTPEEGWPELVGLTGEAAKQIIEDEGRGFTVIIVPPGGVITKDWRPDRVFIFVNDEGHVERTPRPGR